VKRRLLTLALVGLLALLPVPRDAGAQPPRSLTGRLLVATAAMADTRFARTVIYLVRHDERGAFGLIVNLPMATQPYERVLQPFGLTVPPDAGEVAIHYGGPVDGQHGFVLHTPDWKGEGTLVVNESFALTADPRVLEAVARGAGPRRALFCLGRAGWAPGQLDAELETGAWAIARADERVVFDEPPDQKWIEAMTRRILDL
jgi:putative transcriptional regulator